MLFRERSGSTHLCTLLDSHPDILCRTEDFDNRRLNDSGDGHCELDTDQSKHRLMTAFKKGKIVNPKPVRVRQHLHNIYSFPLTACGFKWKFPGQVNAYPELRDELHFIGGQLRILALTRKNVLKQSVSRQNMRRSALANWRFHGQQERPSKLSSHEPFHVDVDKTVSYARFLLRSQEAFQQCVESFECVSNRPALQLDYESLMNERSRTLREIFQFLEVSPDVEVASETVKMTPDCLRTIILNFDQLAKAVAGTELEPMLESEA